MITGKDSCNPREWTRGYESGAQKCYALMDATPAADVVEVSAVEAWLLNIALNNTGRVSNVCEELASRMDGLRKFAADRRE